MASFASVALIAVGTPQSLANAQLPLQPTLQVQGRTSSIAGAGSASQLIIQAAPGNTGNVYIGGPGLVKGTLAACGAVLAPGAFAPPMGSGGNTLVLDQVWFDGDTVGNKLLLSMI